ncbi:MAG: glycosyltransferase family 2 protein [Bacilli bacterium]|nr:glycosyltransferase family 2 protein [Bacilli bacterium]
MKEKISIIIPVYNVEKYLKKCLDSVLNQTYKNFEVICINDGSTDNSLNILSKYAKKDKRIKYFSRSNKGLLYTRLDGIKKSNGKYIIFLDSDDWIDKDYVEVLYKNITIDKMDLTRCNMRIVKNEKEIIKYKKDFDNSEININTLYKEICRNYKYNNAVRQIFRRASIINDINNINTKIALGEDLEFNLNLYKNINRIRTIDYYGYNYRYNQNSITKNIKIERLLKNIQDTIDVYYDLVIFTQKNNENDYQVSLVRMIELVVNHFIRLSFADAINFKTYKNYINQYMDNKKISFMLNQIEYDSLSLIKNKKKTFIKMIYKNKINKFCLTVILFYKPLYRILKRRNKS